MYSAPHIYPYSLLEPNKGTLAKVTLTREPIPMAPGVWGS